jgi:excisionase family DNA binding protein
MENKNIGELKRLFNNYNEVVSVEELSKMLNIGLSSAYNLVRSGQVRTVRCGRKYLIPKQAVIGFLDKVWYTDDQIIGGRLDSVKEGALIN